MVWYRCKLSSDDFNQMYLYFEISFIEFDRWIWLNSNSMYKFDRIGPFKDQIRKKINLNWTYFRSIMVVSSQIESFLINFRLLKSILGPKPSNLTIWSYILELHYGKIRSNSLKFLFFSGKIRRSNLIKLIRIKNSNSTSNSNFELTFSEVFPIIFLRA